MSTAVNEVADNLANISINEQTNGTPAATQNGTTASADEGRRLYIGNLAYATTEGELTDFFKGFTVESVSIPVNPRTNRPVGYAFVDLATAQEAQAAIATLTGKDILERRVSVQVARKPEPTEPKIENGAEGTNGGQRKRGSGRGRGRGRGRGGRFGRGGRANGAKGEGDEVLAEVTNPPEAGAEEVEAPKDDTDAMRGHIRPRKQRGPPEDGIPSKTKVMVANLPYDLSEDKLKELFASYDPISAKIALRPIPRFMVKKLHARGEARKGRGFGFVTLGSEELQQKAVNEMHGKDINGREIAVKVAIDSPGKEDEPLGAETGEVTTQEAANVAA